MGDLAIQQQSKRGIVSAAAKLVVAAYLAYLVWFLAFAYDPTDPLGFHPPMVLWVIDVVNLFIHEAGHLVFRPFGQTLSLLGGSLLQCLLPLALVFAVLRENPQQVAYPLFWFGENLVNVSVYVADAPYRNLKLLREGLVHDWHRLLAEHLSWAEPAGAVLRWVGVATTLAAVAWLVIGTVSQLRRTD